MRYGSFRSKIRIRRHGRFAVLVSLLLVGQVACSLPDDVRQFTGQSLEAALLVRPVMHDLPASCVRAKRADEEPGTFAVTADSAVDACADQTRLEPQLQAALQVLTNYLQALQQLASDDVVNFDPSVENAFTKVQAVGHWQGTSADAAQALAKFLAKAAAGNYRRRQLQADLIAADKDVATLTEALAAVVRTDYTLLLDRERDSTRDRYRLAARGDSSKNPAIAILLQDRWQQQQDEIAARRQKSLQAAAALDEIRSGHQALAAHASEWSEAGLRRSLQNHTLTLRRIIAELRKEIS